MLLSRTAVIKFASNTDDRLRSRDDRNSREILYFPAVLDPLAFYYYPQDRTTIAAAYHNRHREIKLDEYDPRLITRCYRTIRKFVRHPIRWTRQQYVDRIDDPTKRRLYSDALSEMLVGKRVSARVQPFTKIEKLTTKKYKAPRMIQARDVTFNIEYGTYN